MHYPHSTSLLHLEPYLEEPSQKVFAELNVESCYQPQAPPSQGCLDWVVKC